MGKAEGTGVQYKLGCSGKTSPPRVFEQRPGRCENEPGDFQKEISKQKLSAMALGQGSACVRGQWLELSEWRGQQEQRTSERWLLPRGEEEPWQCFEYRPQYDLWPEGMPLAAEWRTISKLGGGDSESPGVL